MINKALNISVLKIDDTVIDNVSKLNFLGVIIEDTLNWKEYIEKCQQMFYNKRNS